MYFNFIAPRHSENAYIGSCWPFLNESSGPKQSAVCFEGTSEKTYERKYTLLVNICLMFGAWPSVVKIACQKLQVVF
jgi:hypothetical protein